MSGYNEIRGLRVKYLSADPANAENGQVWYNNTTGNLRVEGMLLPGAWASASNSNVPGLAGQSGGGNAASGLVGGGDNGGGFPTWPSATQEYDGSIWTSAGNYPISGQIPFAGTSLPTLMGIGGNQNGPVVSTTASYNGSSWTGETNYPVALNAGAGAGTQTALVYTGGGTGTFGGAPLQTATNEYDGSSWTGGGAYPTGTVNLRLCGTQTAALGKGGTTPSYVKTTFNYDGSSWTASTNMNYVQAYGGFGGTQTAALGAFFYSPEQGGADDSEIWDGSSWTIGATLAAPHGNAGGFGTSSKFIAGARFPSIATEEYTGSSIITKNLSVS